MQDVGASEVAPLSPWRVLGGGIFGLVVGGGVPLLLAFGVVRVGRSLGWSGSESFADLGVAAVAVVFFAPLGAMVGSWFGVRVASGAVATLRSEVTLIAIVAFATAGVLLARGPFVVTAAGVGAGLGYAVGTAAGLWRRSRATLAL